MAADRPALQELSRAPLASFLDERKRLAAELRARGDADLAAEVTKRRKPTASVWAVNQLYWQARDAFDAMLQAAAQLRKGDLGARRAYQDALSELRRRAGEILEKAGHGASDAVLRRVATTLGAIGATGGFDPDPPGALTTDRDPPGFEAIGIAPEPRAEAPRERAAAPARARLHSLHPPAKPAASAREEAAEGKRRAEEERARLRAEREAERRRAEEERARRRAARRRLEEALREAKGELRAREHEISALETQRRRAEEALDEARLKLKDLERAIAEQDEAD